MAQRNVFILIGADNCSGFNTDYLAALAADDRFAHVTAAALTGVGFTPFPGIWMYDPFGDNQDGTFSSVPDVSSPFGAYTGKFTSLWEVVAKTGSPATAAIRYNNQQAKVPAFGAMGPEFSLGWRLQNWTGDSIYMAKLAADGTSITARETAVTVSARTGGAGFWGGTSYPTTTAKSDWHPSSDNRMYEILTQGILLGSTSGTGIPSPDDAATYTEGVYDLLNAASDTVNVIGIGVVCGELDAAHLVRATHFETAMKELRDKLRNFIATSSSDLTTLPEHEIPFIMAKVPTSLTYAAQVNQAMQNIAEDDIFAAAVTTSDLEVSGSNYTAAAHITLGDRMADAWEDLQIRSVSANLPGDRRPTLSDMRARVKRRFERSNVSTQASDANVNEYVNDALEHLFNKVGDAAWWLRRIEQFSITTSPREPVELPRVVQHLLRIEDQSAQGVPVKHRMVGHNDAGRLRVLFDEKFVSDFFLHHLWYPPRLTEDTQRLPIPPQFSETVVVEAARRLAQASGNSKLEVSLAVEASDRIKDVRRRANAMDRARHEQVRRERNLHPIRYWRELDIRGY